MTQKMLEQRLEGCIIDILTYLNNNNIEYPQHKYLFDDWADWLDEYHYVSQNLGSLLEDAVIFEDILSKIDDDEAVKLLNRLKNNHKNANKQHESLQILETKTSRMWQHLTQDDKWAIVSPYRSEYSEAENQQRMTQLKKKVRDAGFGFIQFVSRWVENGEAFDEESLMCPGMDDRTAIELGEDFSQSSVIVCKNGKVYEICTTPFETYNSGEIVRKFNLSGDKPMNLSDAEAIFAKRKGGPVSKPKYGKAKPFTLKEMYEIEIPRASYFQTKSRRLKILESI